MPNISTLLVAGLPGSGKTTFLAALWHVAESEEVPGALRLDHLSDEAKHLNSIKNDWHLCQPMVRSILVTEHFPTLCLKDVQHDVTGEVVFPDLEGEIFRDQWKDREWPTEFGVLVGKTECILLFVHPKISEPMTIAEMQRLVLAALDDEGDLDTVHDATTQEIVLADTQSQGSGAGEQWNAELAPTQVQLVGILQFLEPHILAKRPVRLALVVSAWDRILVAQANHPSPADWVRLRLPYLDQYLRSNFELFNVRVYGVSAQGGDLKEDAERLRKLDPASNRIVIEGPDCAPHDITEPVRWALGWKDLKF